MTEALKIYIDRLQKGEHLTIKEKVPPDFLDIHESELHFPGPVLLEGQAYLASDHLIVQLAIKTDAEVPCSICNNFFKLSIDIPDFYHAEPIENIPGKIFDFSEPAREAILLKIPQFAECHGGQCPERSSIQKYIKKNPSPSKKKGDFETHFPFTDLEI